MFGFGKKKDPLNSEYDTLDSAQKAQVDAVIEKARRDKSSASKSWGHYEYYAYPQHGGTAWGINDPEKNVKRGVKP